ncbi:hypothetical protein TNCV_2673021 [Trichonephila clavipes]|nr:hypothetical protein TNCV_2673021 [Trichonephila clavipes]
MEDQLVNTKVLAYLRRVTDGVAGDTIPLTSEHVTVGRFACDVTVQDAKISCNHCCLKHIGKNWILTDLKSSNGTYSGNKRLKPNTSYAVRNGSMFSIGPPKPTTVTARTSFLFTCEEVNIYLNKNNGYSY